MFFSQPHRIPLRALLGAALATILLALAAQGARAASPYQNPFAGDAYEVGRTDMGVDVCLQPEERIRAIGDGVVTGVIHNWFDREPYLWYQLTDGPDAGQYVYVAEQIRRLAHVGQHLRAGQTVARFARSGTCIETGWAASDGWTEAQATTGYHEGQVTTSGVSFARFLMSLGVQGSFELKPTRPRHRHSHKH